MLITTDPCMLWLYKVPIYEKISWKKKAKFGTPETPNRYVYSLAIYFGNLKKKTMKHFSIH